MKTKLAKKLLLLLSFVGVGFVFGAIPSNYIANYDIEGDWNNISKIFVQIEANNKIGVETPMSTFGALHQSFANVFPEFPQEYGFQVVYEQCLQLSNYLSNSYSRDTFSSFMDNCYKPLSQILVRINNVYTVKANAVARPKSGPAPLMVTFDARSSVDPSNDTIPSDNFFRYYRDTQGQDRTIGVGPVINHTFEEAGNHIIHLTVKSSNKISKGILDGSKIISIDVKPKAAVISVFANGKKLKTTEKIKFGTQEGAKGMVLDGSSTIAIGGRQILSHAREISSSYGFKFSKIGDGLPGVIKVILPQEGEYRVVLRTIDNEGNKISEQYSIIVSDPVAIIKQSPELGTTSNTFKFDANASYSVASYLRLYTREIFDNKGNKIQTYQGKNINYQFKEPGAYTVKLTVEDALGQTNTDAIQVYVDSSSPIAQFNIKASETWKYPSSFVLDASPSSDIDEENGFDSLSYTRTFSNPKATNIISTIEGDKEIKVSFDSVGEHKIKLTVQDKFGKVSEIQKIINVQSTLRPEIFAAPKAATWGSPINFVAQTNEEVLTYRWDFGDGDSISTQNGRISHIYRKTGQYRVTLTVYGRDGNENTIVDKVFIGDKNLPMVIYKVIGKNQEILRQNEECVEIIDGKEVINPAYKVERYQNFTIDPKESVNIKGNTSNLAFYFQAKNGDIYKNNSFKSSFNELGCQFIDLTVEDLSLGINQKSRIRFKVYNALPTIKNLTLLFPQYGNEMGVGFNENQVKDIFNTEFDPLIVKVQAAESKDPDGFVSYFKRYYYYKNDPTRPIETKITPGNIPYSYFSLPKIPGEFMFGVTLYDSDGGVNHSENIIGNGPIVFFPPDTKRPDIPMVTLKADKTTVEVGDEVTFDVISKIISDRSDFIQERTIYYDFDGDGERDLITKKDRITYAYTEPSDIGYAPRAAVTYRGYKGIGVGGNIIVKKGLKPRMLAENAGKFVLFRDISLGEIEKSNICLSFLDCRKEAEGYLIDTKETPVFTFEYPEYKKYVVSIDIEDKYANQTNARQTIDLTGVVNSSGEIVNYTGSFKFLSIPKNLENENGELEILVGKSLNNSVAFYVMFDDQDGKKECYVDLDISDDNAKDFYCNQVFFTKFDPKYESIIGKLYYQEGDKMLSKDLRISFIDFSIKLDEKTQVIYDRITKLINSTKNEGFKALLLNLQKGIIDPLETQSNLIAIQNYLLEESVDSLDDSEKQEIQRIVNELSDSTNVSAMGGTEYDIAKKEILQILPSNLSIDVERLFVDFENAKGNSEQQLSQNDQRKNILNDMLALISQKIAKNPENQRPDEIIKDDMDSIIMPNICKIMNYHNIASEKCSSEEIKVIDDSSVKIEKGARSGLKILLIVLLSSAGLLVGVIAFFAIKAKMNKQEDDEDENI